jgi:hypothetical protein
MMVLTILKTGMYFQYEPKTYVSDGIKHLETKTYVSDGINNLKNRNVFPIRTKNRY